MNPPSPLRRVTLSRQRFYSFSRAWADGEYKPEQLLELIRDEIESLEAIAEIRGGSESRARLTERWREFAESVKVKAN